MSEIPIPESRRQPDAPSSAGHSEGADGDAECAAYRAALPIKRVVERIVAFFFVVLISPFLLLIAVAIKIESQGPVLYRQVRAGYGGKSFSMFKFRTMHQDAEERLDEILRHDHERREEHQKYRKLFEDPRHSRIGRVLRRYSLDELPQLFNVLRGEMLLVGPRPYVTSELDDWPKSRAVIFSTVPGMTGLWQVGGRNNLPFEERVRLDVSYASAYSFGTDIAILFRTIPAVVTGSGAY